MMLSSRKALWALVYVLVLGAMVVVGMAIGFTPSRSPNVVVQLYDGTRSTPLGECRPGAVDWSIAEMDPLVCGEIQSNIYGWMRVDPESLCPASRFELDATRCGSPQRAAGCGAYKPISRESFSAKDGVFRRTANGPIIGIFWRPLTDAEVKARGLDDPDVYIPISTVAP